MTTSDVKFDAAGRTAAGDRGRVVRCGAGNQGLGLNGCDGWAWVFWWWWWC